MTSPPTGYSIVMTTTGSRAEADAIARSVVEAMLVACAQIMPIHSVYRWQGAVESSDEFLLLLKTRTARVPGAMAAIRALHSYETPEIIVLPVTAGLPDYLAWIGRNTA